MGKREDSVRIQTSVLNGIEKKVLVWLAMRQPRWMTSDILTGIGTFGAIVIAAGFILGGIEIELRAALDEADPRSVAAIARQYRETLREIDELEKDDGDLDEIARILADRQSRADAPR